MTELLKELEAMVCRIAGDAAEVRRTGGDPERERHTHRSAVNFIRTHHAEIAEALNDATLLRYLVRENNKGGRGAFRIVWFDEGDDGFTTTDGVSVDGKDELAIIRIVSAAMRNSAREAGE